MSDPFFVVGPSRSGTTMLRLLLNGHKRIAIPNELGYFNRLPVNVEAWRQPDLTEAQYSDLIRTFLARCREKFDGVDLDRVESDLLSVDSPNLKEPYRIVAEAWMNHHGKARWGEKTPINIFFVDVLRDMFPQARFILLVRDPRAIVNSMNEIPYFSRDTVLNALNCRHSLTSGVDLLERSVPDSERITVRYETLVGRPEEELERICLFLGEEFDPAMMDFYRSSHRFVKTVRTPSITRPILNSNADKWRNRLSRSQVSRIEIVCAESLERYEYERINGITSTRDHIVVYLKSAYWNFMRWRSGNRRAFVVADRMFGRTHSRVRDLLSRLGGGNSK